MAADAVGPTLEEFPVVTLKRCSLRSAELDSQARMIRSTCEYALKFGGRRKPMSV